MRALMVVKTFVVAAVAAMGLNAWADAAPVQYGTGGVVSQDGYDFVHVFESSGTFTITKAIKVKLLVVGGGGAGGVTIGAGGGGGQAIEQDVVLEPGDYTVTVGKGGKFPAEADNPDWAKSQNNWVYGPDGEDSSFVLGDVTITAEGGGGGGGWDNQGRGYTKGRPGGCGGGATNNSQEPGIGTVVGANGGKSYRESPGGGGGASGEAGGDGTNTGPAGNGGAGFISKITGKELDYGSGGGGGAGNSCSAPGAAGGPGAGAGGAKDPSERGGYGLDGRGGGGGGGGYSPACAGGNGGDGCVIVRYSGIDMSTVLTVASSCEEVGTPDPGYGAKAYLKDGDQFACTMAETVVRAADGKSQWTLAGWALYSVDPVNETETLVRTSETGALAGETQSCCLYTHAGRAKLVWNWIVQDYGGAAVSQVGDDLVYVFEESGTFTVTKAIKAKLLVVGGGGAGGVTIGAGGGGGQVIEQEITLEPGVYAVTVGKGGKFPAEADDPTWASSQNNWVHGPDGEDSSFVLGDVTITAEGGGGGGGWDNQSRGYMKGRPGGCGGGATNNSKEPGIGTVVGADGGKSYTDSPGGGGGASGEAGGDGKDNGPAGNGGSGFISKITGKELDYGSGGGGGAGNRCTAPGAAGGPGAGAGGAKSPSERGGYGLDGRGGGGGGGGYSPARAGGNGGDGCVIVRYSDIDNDTFLTVASSCDEVGTPDPGYGIRGELKAGDALTCTMAETAVQSDDGKTRWTLAGWALYSVDPVHETQTLVRSSETGALEGETESRCLYTHAGCAKLVWNWNVRTALSLANASVQPTSRNAFTVAVDVTSTGFVDGQQVDVYAAWGVDPENLIRTNLISTVSEAGRVSLDVTQDVVPGTVHYVQVFAVADDGTTAVAAGGIVRVALPSASTGALPAGYQQVEYLESDKTQCIDTGIKAESDEVYDGDLEIDITFMTKDYANQTAVIGGGVWNGYQYLIAIQNNKIEFYGYAQPSMAFKANTVYRFVTTSDGKWARFYDEDGNLLGEDSRTDNLKGGKLYIFADGGNYKSAIRVMGCKMWKGGKLVRDFVPAVRIEDGERGLAGFYNVAEDLDAADTVRFFTDPSGKNFAVGADVVDTEHSLLIEGTPENFGKPSPDYGTIANLLPGDTFECRCPETAPSGATFASCLGWSLQTNRSDDASQWIEAESGTSSRMTYVHPADSGARLVWKWGVKYDVTVSAAAGGSAEFASGGTSGSAAPGETLRIVATPNDGYSFAYWTGDVPAAQILDNPLDLTVVGNASLTAHFVSGRAVAWKGGTSSLASDDGNWSDDTRPGSGDAVILSPACAGDIVWDLPDVEPGSWTQLEGYEGTVTFATTFADSAEDFPVFRVSGDVVLEDGVWTHLENPVPTECGQAAYRFKADIGGNLTVGAKARIDANAKGLPGGSGYGYIELGQNAKQGGSYGGRGRNSTMPCYGSVKNPVDVGAGGTPGNRSTTRGGGCIIISVAGAAHVDGVLSANGGMSTVTNDSAKNNATSGGTVSLTAATIDGDGVISADGGAIYDDHSEANMGKYKTSSAGGGGRVALVQKGTGATYDGLPENVSAYASFVFEPNGDGTYTRIAPEGGNILSGAGTVYLEVPSDEGRGKLIVRNPYEGGISYDSFYHTEFGGDAMDADLDFSAIEIGTGGTVRILSDCGMTDFTETAVSGCGRLVVETDLQVTAVCDWDDLTLYPLTDCSVYGSERTEFGGGIEFCTASHAAGDVVFRSGARVSHRIGGNDENGYRIDLTVNGDLDVQDGAVIDVTGKGYPIRTGINFGTGKGIDAYGMNFGPSHGGSGAHESYAEGDYPKPYGSIFCPTNYGAASYYQPGGGCVKIVVKGAATVNGSIVADGGPNPDGYCSGAGGSIWITAAEMSGTGAITANGGVMHHGSPGGAGGRISLMLTKEGADFSQLTGPVTAYACKNISGLVEMRNCGTVYRQTGNQKFGYGEILVANAADSVDKGLPMTLPPAEGMEAKELENATLNLGMLAGVVLEQDLKIGNLIISEDATRLDLANHILRVQSPYHPYPTDRVVNAGEWKGGKKPGWSNIQWRVPGLMIMVR